MAEHRNGDPAEALAACVRGHRVRGRRATVVLPRDAYKLLQINAPDTPAEERAEAARWRIRELVDQPLDELITDAFPVPEGAGRQAVSLMYVVASPRKRVQALTEQVRKAGLQPAAVDIPEMAMRNLAALLPDQRGGVAMLWPSGGTAHLTISRGDTLHLARQVELPSVEDHTVRSEAMALELQRSLDFYESRTSGASVSRLLVMPCPDFSVTDCVRDLSNQLPVAVATVPLTELLVGADELDAETLDRCSVALGAALRGMRLES